MPTSTVHTPRQSATQYNQPIKLRDIDEALPVGHV